MLAVEATTPCPDCGAQVPVANQELHRLRCRASLRAEMPALPMVSARRAYRRALSLRPPSPRSELPESRAHRASSVDRSVAASRGRGRDEAGEVGTWTCQLCTLENDAGHRQCAACGFSQHRRASAPAIPSAVSVGASSSSDAGDAASPSMGMATAAAAIAAAASAVAMVAANAAQREDAARFGPTWICPDCTFANSAADTACAVCYRARPRGGHGAAEEEAGQQAAATLGQPAAGLPGVHQAAPMPGDHPAASQDPLRAPAPAGVSEALPWMYERRLLSVQLQAASQHVARLAQRAQHPPQVPSFPQIAFPPQLGGYPAATPQLAGLPGAGYPTAATLQELIERRRSLQEVIQQIGSDGPRPIPAEPGAVQSLPTCVVCEGDLDRVPTEHRTCTICMDEFAVGDEQRTLPCFHRFHKACVDQWLERSGTCPICKHRVEDSESSEEGSHSE